MDERLSQWCAEAVARQANDLFLREDSAPVIRVNGELVALEGADCEASLFEQLHRDHASSSAAADLDFPLEWRGIGRFRVNLFKQSGRWSAVLRPIKREVPVLSQLGLPSELIQSWMLRKAGLILFSGATGAGKSTSIASALNWLSQQRPKHLVTLEDPIEFLLEPGQSLVTQREIGTDVPTFEEGLRSSLRQSPDVIFIGEIRDQNCAEQALRAAETGHLVVSTVHASGAAETLERFAFLFPAAERERGMMLLASQLLGVVCQQLLDGPDGERHLALEYFENAALIRDHIRHQRINELNDLILSTPSPERHSFQQSLIELVRSGKIPEETAANASPRPSDLKRALRGIS